MLRTLKDLEKCTLSATDGEIGKVVNFLFDDVHWAIRYLVAETDGLFDFRSVLISPVSFRKVEWAKRRFEVALTIDKINNSPSVDVAKPVTRQHERDYYRYYGYPYYWGYSGIWGLGAYPGLLSTGKSWNQPADDNLDAGGDVHLRSANDLRGYHIQGSDEAVGHVSDFIVDDETWAIRYLVIDTSNWWFGKKVLVAPNWATSVSWEERKVFVSLSREEIKKSPPWQPDLPINRDYEQQLHATYNRPGYWEDHGNLAAAALTTHAPQHRPSNRK